MFDFVVFLVLAWYVDITLIDKHGFFALCATVTTAKIINSFNHDFHYQHSISAMQKCRVRCRQHELSCKFGGIHALRMHLKTRPLEDL
jgi:hypothetical protein